ncbi:MAG: AAA family ATPase [Desulfobacterales bacterium]|nr:AAA family ATPase [Desulfobacterales bacterium]
MSFGKHVNVIHGPNGAGKTTLLKILRSAMLGDSSPLRNVHFKSAELEIVSEKEKKRYRHTIRKKDVLAGDGARDGSGPVSAWRVEPRPRNMESPPWPHLYLPTSRLYMSHGKFAIFHPGRGAKGASRGDVRGDVHGDVRGDVRGDALETNLTHGLSALWTECHHEYSEHRRKAIAHGLAGILNSFFSKRERRRRRTPGGAPESEYARVCAYLERYGLEERIISFSTFKKIRRQDAGVRNVIKHIVSTEKKIDVLNAERETLRELANGMLGGGKTISIGIDGLRMKSKRNEPIGWSALSAGERNALIILFATLVARGGVLLIDDVDFSLHDDLRGDLTRNMRRLNPAGQFILTTHSSRIVKSVNKEGRFRM